MPTNVYPVVPCVVAICLSQGRFSRWQRHYGNQRFVRLVETMRSTSLQIKNSIFEIDENFFVRQKKKDPLNID